MQTLFRRLRFSYWYFRQPPWDTGITPPELLDFIQTHPPGRAIDLGCGTGTNVITLARRGWQVTGVDFAPPAIAQAKRKLKAAGLSADLRVGDVTQLDRMGGPFDLAFDLGCFHGIPPEQRARYLDQLDRLLTPGGYWLMYGFLSEADHTQPGLQEAEIGRLSARLSPVSRQDGFDARQRRSVWLLFQKATLAKVV